MLTNIQFKLVKQKDKLGDSCEGCIFDDLNGDCVSKKFIKYNQCNREESINENLIYKLDTKKTQMTNDEAIKFILDNPSYFFKTDDDTVYLGYGLWIYNNKAFDCDVENLEYKETINSEYKKLEKES